MDKKDYEFDFLDYAKITGVCLAVFLFISGIGFSIGVLVNDTQINNLGRGTHELRLYKTEIEGSDTTNYYKIVKK